MNDESFMMDMICRKTEHKCPYTLYRHFDADGVLLYIGISGAESWRRKEHAKKSPWFPEVARTTTETVIGRVEALKVERAAIQAENPKYNKAGRKKA